MAFIELGSLYEPQFYDAEGIPLDLALEIKQARRMARHFVREWDRRYQLNGQPKRILKSLYQELIVRLAAAFVRELEINEAAELESFHPSCTSENVKEALIRHFDSKVIDKDLSKEFAAALASNLPLRYSLAVSRMGIISAKHREGAEIALGVYFPASQI